MTAQGQYYAHNDKNNFFKKEGQYTWSLKYDTAGLKPVFTDVEKDYIFTSFGGKFYFKFLKVFNNYL